MSTKIFVHRVYKQPQKDPDFDRLFAEAVTRREAERDRKEQNRRIMAELRNEELYQRAAKLPKPEVKSEKYHCRYCWGMEKATLMLGRNKKVLDRLYRGVVYGRADLLQDPWRVQAEMALGEALEKTAKFSGVTLSEDELAKIAVKTFRRSIEALENLQEERRAKNQRLHEITGAPFLGERLIIDVPPNGYPCVAEEITE